VKAISENLRNKKAIVAGASAGGITAITSLLKYLPAGYELPMIIVLHQSPHSGSFWINNLNDRCQLQVKEAEEKEIIQKGNVYLAPPNYHLLIEKNRTFSLSVEEKVNFSRPSIDVLFETAADAFKDTLIGILLTGASRDGA
jgi:two-component system chemotaxis response regulator CheB